nr:unnamed protein product [Spirometra erinaceieuropaei]
MRQESNQFVSDFITNLTLAIQDCGYKEIKADNFEHAMLVQQLIVGLRDGKARKNLLSEKKDLSWEKACDIASHQERVRQNLQQLNQSNDAEILRLNSVSDRQRYHQLLKEEALGDRKPSELLRGMRSLLGDRQVDDKFDKEMFLTRLPADVQTILACGSQDLTVSRLAEMADRTIEVQRFQSASVARISSSSSSVNENLVKQVSAMADEMASLEIQLARLTSSRSRSRRRSRSRPRTAILAAETGKPVGQRIDAAVFSGSSGSGRTFFVCDTATRGRFLVDTRAQISVVPPTAADRRFPSPGLHLQAANCSPIPTFGSLSLTLNIGLRRSLTWIFVIADVPHAILGSDFLAEFDLLVDCRRARLLDRTTGLFVRGLTPFTVPTNLSVLDTDIASPFRQLLLSHPA